MSNCLFHEYSIKVISEKNGFRCRLFFIDWERDCGMYPTEREAVIAGTDFMLHHWEEHEDAMKKNKKAGEQVSQGAGEQ